jgi:translation elongation factor P/translation initiation factor 5A
LFADGSPVRLQEFLHVKPGKGSAFVRTKIKNLVSGSVQERTFRAGESIIAADVSKTEMQYTYKNGDMLCFMNMETFEEQVIDKDKIANVDLLIEGKIACEAIELRIMYTMMSGHNACVISCHRSEL